MRRIVLVLLLVATILLGACDDSDTGSDSVWCTTDGGVCTERGDDTNGLELLLTWPGD